MQIINDKITIPVSEMERWCLENGYKFEKKGDTFTIFKKEEPYVCPECLNNYSKEDCALRCGNSYKIKEE